MPAPLSRRRFLQGSAVAAWTPAFACTGMVRDATGAETPRIEVPVVDRLAMQVVLDGAHDIFISGAQVPGIRVERTRLMGGGRQQRTFQSEWGLSLHLEAQAGPETRRYLLDFGYTPEALNNNLDLLDVDLAADDALILNHGHYDHMGGLLGFLARHRKAMREDLRLYLGGEDAFCHRVAPAGNGAFADAGMLDRRGLAAARVRPILSEEPLVVDGHAFTTGAIPRTSIERVLPNTFVEFGVRDGAGCDPALYRNHHFTAAELSGQPQPDQHLHEHATCFHVRGRGLVVITSPPHHG